MPNSCFNMLQHPKEEMQENNWSLMMKDVGFTISKEDLASGPEIRWDHSGLLSGISFITVKRDRESFWHRRQKGDGEFPLN